MIKMIILFLLISRTLFAQTGLNPAQKFQIVEASASVYMSETIPIKDLRKMAFRHAIRNALEKVGIKIKANTTVEKSMTIVDVIKSWSSGKVVILDKKDIGIKSDTRYHVWIKAKVISDVKDDVLQGTLEIAEKYLRNAQNQFVNLKEFTSKRAMDGSEQYFIFLFWDYYCGPCLSEMDYLSKQVTLNNVKVITINMDIPENLKAFNLAKNKVKGYTHFLNLFPVDNAQRIRLSKTYKIKYNPLTIFTNGQRQIIWTKIGFPAAKEDEKLKFRESILSHIDTNK